MTFYNKERSLLLFYSLLQMIKLGGATNMGPLQYPRSFYSFWYEKQGGNAANHLKVYTNFNRHCSTTRPQTFPISNGETYTVSSSTPRTQFSPFVNSFGYILPEFIARRCFFTIEAPSSEMFVISVNMTDFQCHLAMRYQCKFKIFYGTPENARSSELFSFPPRTSGSPCSYKAVSEFEVKENSLYFEVGSCGRVDFKVHVSTKVKQMRLPFEVIAIIGIIIVGVFIAFLLNRGVIDAIHNKCCQGQTLLFCRRSPDLNMEMNHQRHRHHLRQSKDNPQLDPPPNYGECVEYHSSTTKGQYYYYFHDKYQNYFEATTSFNELDPTLPRSQTL